MEDLVAVIMAGGDGQRFWPLSTADRPKQFLDLEHSGRSLLQATYARLLATVGSESRILVVCGVRHTGLVREQLPQLPGGNLLVEPVGRDTAPCIGLAALTLLDRFGDTVMGVFPSDHRVIDVGRFQAVIGTAAQTARERQALVTLGIEPTRPSTAYGYIQRGAAVGDAHEVLRFVEKPDRARAERYLEDGTYLWNSGMFVWTVDTILRELRRHAPDIMTPLTNALAGGRVPEVFPTLPRSSIDYAVMEKSTNAVVLPADFDWDDLGDWEALSRISSETRDSGDTVVGPYIGVDTRGNIVFSDDEEGIVVALGVEDLVIVKRHTTTLILRRDRVQDIKKLLADPRLVERRAHA
jgi:mannose-1-phosphate guanylyltransferase